MKASLVKPLAPQVCLLLGWLAWCMPAVGELRIRDICRVKGQEENTLHGLGLVVGLNGTGDGQTPTTRALAKMMELMGNSISKDAKGQLLLDELKSAKNVALVFVSATIPAEGARQGEQLNCSVNAIGAKSLAGGYLMMTPLVGPRPGNPRIYAFAQGPIALQESGPLTSGKVHNGCRLEENFENTFAQDGKVTLVLDKNHASFETAYTVEESLNGIQSAVDGRKLYAEPIAKARDPLNIEVTVPAQYKDNPVQFVSEILETRMYRPQNDARVVINQRDGVIIIGDNVEVGRVAVTHKNLTIQTGNPPADGPLFVLDQAADTSTTKLKALVDALNALKVGTADIIDIIKALERSGDLFGRLIVE